ncbi:MAG: prepilin-type N-terminal cleavage/methylation domain-containing protein [Thermodesulfovibrionales bacterium]|nr:prepilin-type N-terminal cleavage/methylation domain-containing protein [Thermodesulfovibrionales bacterium]
MSLKKGHKGRGTGKADYARLTGSRGFSIVELMIAMVILLFVALAMMQTAMVTMDSNARNVIRDEGVRLASEKLNWLKTSVAEDDLGAKDGTSEPIDRDIRNMKISYTVTYGVTTLAVGEVAKIEVTVSWSWRQQDYDVTLSTIRALTS